MIYILYDDTYIYISVYNVICNVIYLYAYLVCCLYENQHMYLHVCMQMNIYIYLHIYAHLYIYAYINMYPLLLCISIFCNLLLYLEYINLQPAIYTCIAVEDKHVYTMICVCIYTAVIVKQSTNNIYGN